MKKHISIILSVLLLCGCQSNDTEQVSECMESTAATTAITEITTEYTETTLSETTLTETSKSVTTAAHTEPISTETTIDVESETVLQRAIRLGKEIPNRDSTSLVIFSDIDGDSFPEMLVKDFYRCVYKYTDACGWYFIYGGGDPCEFVRNTYYDKTDDSYFHIDIAASCVCDYIEWSCRTTYSENGEPLSEPNFSYKGYYPVGYWYEYDEKGCFAEYSANGKYSLMRFNEWNGPSLSNYQKFVEASYSEYELIDSIDIGKAANNLFEKYNSENETDCIFDGEFADEPTLLMGKPSALKPDIITIGDRGYNEDSTCAYLYDDEITEENFEKLARLPKLTSLTISSKTPSELTGISKLANLKSLTLCKSIDNFDELKKLTKLESLRIYPADDIEYLRDMDSVRVLYLCYTLDKPDDYYAPVADMDSLEYLAISAFERSITDEQEKWLNENLSDVNLSFYKFG